MTAAAAGLHVVVEKPMALTLDDADAMIRACDTPGVKLFVVKQNRFNVPVVKAARGAGAGPFRQARARHGAGALVPRQSYYDQDAVARHLGAGRRRPRQPGQPPHRPARMDDGRRWRAVHAATALVEIEAEDTAVVTLRLRQRRARRHRGDHRDPAEGSRRLALDPRRDGTVGDRRLRGQQDEPPGSSRNRGPATRTCWGNSRSIRPNVYGFGHQAYYEHVVDCLQTDSAALVDGLGGRRSLELITAIYESIETGDQVPLRFDARHSRLGARPK